MASTDVLPPGEEMAQVDEDNCVRGLVVIRGPGWEWGDQDGGNGHVGVVLRKLYVRNPCAPPRLKDSEGELLGDDWAEELGLQRICLAQVRWATSGCVQTYRVGTYGRSECIMTISDLCIAPEQDHESALPLRRMYEFRGKGPEILEDIATLVIGDVIPSPVALEDILVRFFRPRPNVMALMHHVSNVLRDERLGVQDRMCAVCDFCEMPLDPEQGMGAVGPACDECESIGHDWCACEAEGEDGGGGGDTGGVWATRLPCGHIFHRDCIRLCLMEDVCCPCSFCGYEFEGAAACGGDEDDMCAAMRGDHAGVGDVDDGERDVSGVTLRFICENERLWLRIALLVKHFEASDNMSPCRRAEASVWEGVEGGKEEGRKAAMMRKERDVITCVDLPQLEEKAWDVSTAVMMMLIGERSRQDLIAGVDPDSTAVIDHLLDTLSRREDELLDELGALAVRGRREASILDPEHLPLVRHLARLGLAMASWNSLHSNSSLTPPSTRGASATSSPDSLRCGASLQEAREVCLLKPVLRDLFGWECSCVFEQLCRGQPGEVDAERLVANLASPSPTASPALGFMSPSASAQWGDGEKLMAAALASPSASPSLRRRCGDGVRQFAEMLLAYAPGGQGMPPALDLASPTVEEGEKGKRDEEGWEEEAAIAMLRVAILQVENSCSRFCSSHDSAIVGFRWLRSVSLALLERGRLLIRSADPFMVTVVAPHAGVQLALHVLGFVEVKGGLSAACTDKAIVRRFCALLTDRILAPPPARAASAYASATSGYSPSAPAMSAGASSPPDSAPCRVRHMSSAGRASLINDTNLDLVCRWISSKIQERPGEDEWSVLEVEVFPRLEDIGIGYEGSFGRALTRVLNGEREVEELTYGCDPATRTAVTRVVKCLQAKA